mmetsp:Transcript_9671/g.27104  ORF Transcript_9671/g.27104 Transcript_9671/m.27104 type:complete len:510 (-) Transcript_9671:70-1599(-)
MSTRRQQMTAATFTTTAATPRSPLSLLQALLSSLLICLVVIDTCPNCGTGAAGIGTALALSPNAAVTKTTRRIPRTTRVFVTSTAAASTSASTTDTFSSSAHTTTSTTAAGQDDLPSPLHAHALSQLQLRPTSADLALQGWCTTTAGIALSPSVLICTTSQSVAGRGVFATDKIEEGDVVALIPKEVVLWKDNCAGQFGRVATELEETMMKAARYGHDDGNTESMRSGPKKSGRKRRWVRKLLSRLILRRPSPSGSTATDSTDLSSSPSSSQMITDESTMWAPILTRYAMEAMQTSHPWSEWIAQWNRNDPMHDAYLAMDRIVNNQAADTTELPECGMMYEELIASTARKLKAMMPHLNEKHMQAAVSIRLSRLEEHFRIVGLLDDDEDDGATDIIDPRQALELYSLITSRAIELDSDTGMIGVLPFYDLCNHSLDPNLALEFVENDGGDGSSPTIDSSGFYSIYARRDIEAGDELFFQYTSMNEPMDENSALWAGINWGIPHSPSQYS